MTHTYNTNNNNINNEENENDRATKTSDLIINLEKKLISRFDGVGKEIFNLKRCDNYKPPTRKSTSADKS